jgi:hypothetical protein
MSELAAQTSGVGRLAPRPGRRAPNVDVIIQPDARDVCHRALRVVDTGTITREHTDHGRGTCWRLLVNGIPASPAVTLALSCLTEAGLVEWWAAAASRTGPQRAIISPVGAETLRRWDAATLADIDCGPTAVEVPGPARRDGEQP